MIYKFIWTSQWICGFFEGAILDDIRSLLFFFCFCLNREIRKTEEKFFYNQRLWLTHSNSIVESFPIGIVFTMCFKCWINVLNLIKCREKKASISYNYFLLRVPDASFLPLQLWERTEREEKTKNWTSTWNVLVW